MKIHKNLRELLLAYETHCHDLHRLNEDSKVSEMLVDKFLANNSLSEGERQPVSDNEGNESKCSHNGPRFNPTWGEVVCSLCLEQLE